MLICHCGCGKPIPERPWHKRHPSRFLHGHAQRGKRAYGWKGGRRVTKRGYVLIWKPDHPNCMASGYMFEHRFVWEQANGRLLTRDEDVHHIDGDRQNNAPENLIALPKEQHQKEHRHRRKYRRLRESYPLKAAAMRRRYDDPAERQKAAEAARKGWEKRRAKH